MASIKTKIYWFVLIVLVGTGYSCSNESQIASAPPPKINVVKVIQQDVPLYDYFVGQIYGEEDIAINARVEGFLTGIHFEEGGHVSNGELLYTIDQEPFKAAVANEKSRVAEALTKLVNAQNEYQRYEPLAEIDAVSQSDLDFTKANRDAAQAAYEAAKASLRMAEINLGYTNIKAPISGFIGKTQARVGEFVGRSPSPVLLNTVSKIDKVRVQFFITESQYLALARWYINNQADTEGANERREQRYLELILSDGSTHPYKGKVDFINREVDAKTGAILVQASFPNPNQLLRPGQFGRVKILVRVDEDALLVPQRCVSEMQGKYFVFVVDKENKVLAKEIEVGEKQADLWLINSGLNADDKIVIEGLQKVGPGAVVQPEIIEFESATQEAK